MHDRATIIWDSIVITLIADLQELTNWQMIKMNDGFLHHIPDCIVSGYSV